MCDKSETNFASLCQFYLIVASAKSLPPFKYFVVHSVYGNKTLAAVHLVTHHVRRVMAPVRRSASPAGLADMLYQERVLISVLMGTSLTRSAVSASSVL